MYRTVRNILFEKEEQADYVETHSDKDADEIQPLNNNLKQQEIEAKMFENVQAKRPRKKPMARALFANVSIKTPSLFWKQDKQYRIKCNPLFAQQEKAYFDKDRKMMEKRKQGKLYKLLA